MQKVSTEFDDDEFDDFGTAALEQYESTQRTTGDIATAHSASTGINPMPTKTTTKSSRIIPSRADSVQLTMEQLQEENFTKDGEVKVLRSEKERLLSELRKQEEQLQESLSRFTTEKKNIETQLSREKDSLLAKLQFQEQEMASLREKCILLEQHMKKSSSAVKPVPISKPIKTPGSSKASTSSTTTFLSTETFMPQVNTDDVIPIHVKSKRTSRERLGSTSDKQADIKPKKARVSRSPSSSENVKEKKGSKSSKIASLSTEPPLPTGIDPSLVLHDVPRELDDSQLLMLLVRPDLLKPPIFETESKKSDSPPAATSDKDSPSSEDDDDKCSQINSDDSPNSLSGLLSLLRVEPESAAMTAFLTPSFASAPDGFMSLSPSVSTPVEPTKSSASKLATDSETMLDLATFPFSDTNTPVSSEQDAKIYTLVDSVDKKGLEKSITGLLQSADMSSMSKATTFSNTSFCPNKLYSRMRENSNVQLLIKNITATVVQYHSDQTARAKGLANSSMNDGVENTEPSPNLGSHKLFSSSGSSKASSDLFVPLKCDQQLVSSFLHILEILVTYFKSVREQILFEPPKLVLDSQSESSVEMCDSLSTTSSPSSRIIGRRLWKPVRSDLAEVSRRLSLREDRSATPDSPPKETTVSYTVQCLLVY